MARVAELTFSRGHRARSLVWFGDQLVDVVGKRGEVVDRRGRLLGILQEHFNPREEGWLWIALYADGRDGGVVNQIEGQYEGALATARGVAAVINEIGPDRAYIALCRSDGRPTEEDRALWRELRDGVPADVLVDMAVFSEIRAWSMRKVAAAARSA